MNLITLKASLTKNSTRVETLSKKQWLVAPAVLIVEGVLNGLYVPAHEIEIPTLSWNGRPVPLYHPEEGDGSANVPAVIEQSVIGAVYNARYENRSLKAELWLDIAKCNELGGEAAQLLVDIQANKLIELSTGYYCLVQQQAGQFNGIPYHGITQHILPDHVAILPSQVGACSVADGCGVNRNKQEERPMPKKEVKTNFHFTANAMSHEDIKRLLRQALASTVQAVAGSVWIYIPDVYEDRVVYEIEVENAAGQVQAEILQRPYTISDAGLVELGDPVEKVIPVSSYQVVPGTPIFNHSLAEMGGAFIQKVEAAVNAAIGKIFPKEQVMKEKLIKQIKNAGMACMTDEQLAQLPEAALEAMAAGLVSNVAEPTTEPAAAAAATEPSQPTTEPAAAGQEVPAWAAALTQRMDQIGTAVAALQSNHQAAEKSKRDQLVAELVGNSSCPLSDPADFAGMQLAQLEKMAQAYQPASYVGLPFGVANDAGQYEYAQLSINTEN